jgi:hypothetical protein
MLSGKIVIQIEFVFLFLIWQYLVEQIGQAPSVGGLKYPKTYFATFLYFFAIVENSAKTKLLSNIQTNPSVVIFSQYLCG